MPRMFKMHDMQEITKEYSDLLQEAQEQVIIVEQSIKICEESNTVIAKYPFLKDLVEFLTKRHNGHDNKSQALKVYQG